MTEEERDEGGLEGERTESKIKRGEKEINGRKQLKIQHEYRS